MIDTKLILIEGMAGSGKSTTGQKILDLLKDKGFEAKFFHEFSKEHPIINYDESDLSKWIELTIQRWSDLVENIIKRKILIILDASFFQCTIGELLERDASKKNINEYAKKLVNIIRPANPALIYFYQNDIESALKKVYRSRGQKWQNKVCTFLDGTVFGKSNSQTSYELYLEFNKILRKYTDRIFNDMNIHKLSLENSNADWPSIHRKINQFLQI